MCCTPPSVFARTTVLSTSKVTSLPSTVVVIPSPPVNVNVVPLATAEVFVPSEIVNAWLFAVSKAP